MCVREFVLLNSQQKNSESDCKWYSDPPTVKTESVMINNVNWPKT